MPTLSSGAFAEGMVSMYCYIPQSFLSIRVPRNDIFHPIERSCSIVFVGKIEILRKISIYSHRVRVRLRRRIRIMFMHVFFPSEYRKCYLAIDTQKADV
jgi:hypothetical protein